MKILIIKLGAKGDVVRTLPVLIALKEKFPHSEITWITKKSSEEIVKSSPYINDVMVVPLNFKLGEFDAVYNFDIEKEATNLAEEVKAKKKYGFYSSDNYVLSYNLPSEYYLNTLFDDELKKLNKKTYQQMIFEIAELDYKKQHHPIYLTEHAKKYAKDFQKNNNLFGQKLIGIHIGASKRWPSKAWHNKNILDFIIKAKEEKYEILILSGPDETEKFFALKKELDKRKITFYHNEPNNSDLEFASLISICEKIICPDSFSLHLALGLKKPTIGLFFCTSPNEIEDYNLLKKIVSPRLNDFFPEKMDQYSEDLVKSISADEVLNAIEIKNNKG
ncbi:MAG: glycosyltransferase family 9 protein [Nanoarchaeota archaeon]